MTWQARHLERAEAAAREAREALLAARGALARANDRLRFARASVAHQVERGGNVAAASEASEAARLAALEAEDAVDMARAVSALRDEELAIARQTAQGHVMAQRRTT